MGHSIFLAPLKTRVEIWSCVVSVSHDLRSAASLAPTTSQSRIPIIADRYVDTEREFGRLLDELSARLRNRPERRLQPSACPGQS